MSDEKLSEKCLFDCAPFKVGRCEKEADYDGVCGEHRNEKCILCKGQATHYCTKGNTESYGVEMCDQCCDNYKE